MWAEDYTEFLKQDQKKEFKRIDNSKLFDPITLQRKINIQEDEDFSLVGSKTWQFLKRMYGGGPELPFKQNNSVIHNN